MKKQIRNHKLHIRITGLLLTLIMLVGTFGTFSLTASAESSAGCAVTGCDGTYTNGFCSADGTHYEKSVLNSDGYYEIFNAGQLFWFAAQVNIEGNTTANAKLMADINLENRRWYPIGVYQDAVDVNDRIDTVKYSGKFDGNYHTVSNFVATGNGSQGLIGYTDASVEIKNLGVINATVSGWNAGAVLAYQGKVENCYAINCKITAYTTSNTAVVRAGAIASTYGATVMNCFAYHCEIIVGEGMKSKAQITPIGGYMNSDTFMSYYYNVTTNHSFITKKGATEMTVEQFASGEVAYILNSNQTEQVWGQTLTGDNRQNYPVLGGAAVYHNRIDGCTEDTYVYEYSNTQKDTATVHAWNEGVVTTAPTCTEKGVKTYTCTHSSEHTKTEEIPALGHAYDNACDATCNTCGEERTPAKHYSENVDGKCDECGESFKLSGGAIAGIAVGSAAVAGLGGFSLFWFVIKKKTWADFIAIFKKK